MPPLSESVRTECELQEKDGIIIQTVTPGIVLTDMAPKIAKRCLKIPESHDYCKNAVDTIGWLDETYRLYPEK